VASNAPTIALRGRAKRKVRSRVLMVTPEGMRRRDDQLASEEPLELRLAAGHERRTLAVTMRTPGHDFELAAGFLYGEGVVRSRGELQSMVYCNGAEPFSALNVTLRRTALPDLRTLERHFYTTSACGVCGRASLAALEDCAAPLPEGGVTVAPEVLLALPGALRAAQGLFDVTGALHAAALFTPAGELVAVREDVGRHNALDKLVGWALLADALPLSEHVLLLSGRASFELVQKALAAGIRIVCAVSGPSSLAVALARRFRLTLVGFLRGERFNVYAGEERVALARGVSR
jgi:FdhD protein